MTNTLQAAAKQALHYMESVGQMDMYPDEWQIVLNLRAALATEQPQPVRCPDCNDTSLRDTGGTYPDGAPVVVPCDCSAPPPPAGDRA